MRASAVPAAEASATALPNLETIIRGLLYVYIFSLPFNRLLFIERNGFIILVALLVLWCAVNRRHFFTRTPIDVSLLAFVAWVAFTVPFATFPAYSGKEFAKLLQQGLLFYVVLYFFREGRHGTRLVWTFMATLFIVSAYGLRQFGDMVTGRVTVDEAGNAPLLESVMSGEVWLTTYLVLLVPLSVSLACFEAKRGLRMLYAITGVMALLCLIFTFSRAGLLALVCELWVFVWLIKRRRALIAAALASLAVVATAGMLLYSDVRTIPGTGIHFRLSADTFIHRLDIWNFTAAKLAEHPVVGIGYGKDNFRLVFGQTKEEVQPGHTPVMNVGTHNLFLDLALGVGFPGLALFVWLLYRIVASTLTGYHRAADVWQRAVLLGIGVGLIGLTVRVCFDQMLVGTLAIQFWVLVAMAMAVSSAPAQASHSGSR